MVFVPIVSARSGLDLSIIRSLSTVQLVLSTACIGAQIGFFFVCYLDTKCLIYPASATSILYLVAAISGIVAGSLWKRYLIAIYLIMSNLAVMLTAILAIVSYGRIREEFWLELGYPGTFQLQILSVWMLLLLCLGESILFVISVIVCGVALSRFDSQPKITVGEISKRTSLQSQ